MGMGTKRLSRGTPAHDLLKSLVAAHDSRGASELKNTFRVLSPFSSDVIRQAIKRIKTAPGVHYMIIKMTEPRADTY